MILNELGTCQFALPGAYDLFQTLRFGRMGAADPTVHLTPRSAQKSLWLAGEPHRVLVTLGDGAITVKQWEANLWTQITFGDSSGSIPTH